MGEQKSLFVGDDNRQAYRDTRLRTHSARTTGRYKKEMSATIRKAVSARRVADESIIGLESKPPAERALGPVGLHVDVEGMS